MDLFKKTRDARVEDALCLKKNSSPLKTVTCTAVSRGEVSSRDSKYIILSFTTKTREKERDREERKREKERTCIPLRDREDRACFLKRRVIGFVRTCEERQQPRMKFLCRSRKSCRLPKKELKKSIFQTSGGQSALDFFRLAPSVQGR